MYPFSCKCHLRKLVACCLDCPQDIKEAAYIGLARPVLEYGSSVWDPHTKGLYEELEKLQNRAARFVTRNYTFEEGSMTGILEQLKWESFKKKRTDNRLILLYKGLKGKARIPTDDLIPKTRRCRNSHSKAFHLPRPIHVVYFPRLSGTKMTSLTLCFPLLKCQMIVCPSSLHSCVLGTNFFPIRTLGEI